MIGILSDGRMCALLLVLPATLYAYCVTIAARVECIPNCYLIQ